MVHHDQEGIKPGGEGKIRNEIAGDLAEREGARGGDRHRGGRKGMGVRLILLAGGTASHESADVRGKTGPPEVGSDKLAGLEKARVARSGMIMATAENVTSKSIIRGNINMALVSKDAVNVLPIRKPGAEGGGNGAIHRLEGLEDKGIGGRGGGDARGESGIDDVDEQGRRKEGNIDVVRIRGGKKVRAAGKGVGTGKMGPWDMCKAEVKVRKV